MADTAINNGWQFGQSQGAWGPYWASPVKGLTVSAYDSGSGIAPAATWTSDAFASVRTRVDVTTPAASECNQVAACFDGELPGVSTTKVHVVWMSAVGGAGSGTLRYRTVDAVDGSLGTIRNAKTGLTVGNTVQNRCSVHLARSGRIYIVYSTQVEDGCVYSDDGGATWNTAASPGETPTEEDWLMLTPANTDDTNDIACFFWDRSADAVTVKMYDASANTWTESGTSISRAEDGSFRNWDCALRFSDNRTILALSGSGASLLVYECQLNSIASPTLTAKTAPTDVGSYGDVCVQINQQDDTIRLGYLRGTIGSSVLGYSVTSSDAAATWGSEAAYSETAANLRLIHAGRSVGAAGGRFMPYIQRNDTTNTYVNEVNDIEIAAAPGGGPVALAGEARSMSGAGGAMVRDVPLVAAAASESEATGALRRSVTLAAASLSRSSAAGALTRAVALAASALSRSSTAGALSRAVTLSATAVSKSATAAALRRSVALAAAAVSRSSVSGALLRAITLASSALSRSRTAAKLDVEEDNAVALSGTALSRSIAAGALTRAVSLQAAAVSASDATGVLRRLVVLLAAASARSEITGLLRRAVSLQAAALSASDATAVLVRLVALVADARSRSEANADLNVRVLFVSTVELTGRRDATVELTGESDHTIDLEGRR